MNEQSKALSTLKNGLPQNWHEAVDELAESTLQSDRYLRLILVGAFSVGKSSLLNMLMGERLLHTALEEATALPTFIEYGSERSMQLIGSDGSTLPLDASGFARVTTHAPEGAACAVLTLPMDWLKGVSVIDLPGLGGNSASNSEYTLAQIQQADAVLYLLAPIGPSAADIIILNQIRQYGKRIKIIAAQWDIAEEARTRGEEIPSLENYATQIEQETGIKARIDPVNKDGLGREAVLDFINRARDDIAAIRQMRFNAELRPILENAIGQNAKAQRICEVNSEETSRALQTELLQNKQTLTDLKAKLYENSQDDRTRLDNKCEENIGLLRAKFDHTLSELATHVVADTDWEEFGTNGAETLRSTLVDTAMAMSKLSEGYGDLQLPESQIQAFNLRLPPPEIVEAQDFLDMGRFSQLQSYLELKQADIAAKEQALSELSPINMDENQRALQALIRERHQIAEQPLPKIIQRTSGGGGAMIGRMIGEVADIGLMFVNPVSAGTKIASLVGKGAKVAKIASKGIKVAQAIQIGKKVAGVPQQAIDKLGMLEVLSLGYWGERIGSALDGPMEKEIVDPEALAQQEFALSDMDAKVRAVKSELSRCEDIANEHQLTGWALEQNRKEQEHIKADLNRITQQAEQKHREAQEIYQIERLQMLNRHVERAVTQWLKRFDQQSNSMTELLRARVRTHWEDHVGTMLGERVLELELLMAQATAVPAEKEAALAILKQDASALNTTLMTLA